MCTRELPGSRVTRSRSGPGNTRNILNGATQEEEEKKERYVKLASRDAGQLFSLVEFRKKGYNTICHVTDPHREVE